MDKSVLLVINALKNNPSMSIRSIAEATGLSHGMIQRILSVRLNAKKVDDNWALPSPEILQKMGYFEENEEIEQVSFFLENCNNFL